MTEVKALLLDISNALRNPGQTYPVAAQVELEPVEVLGDTIRFGDISLKGTMVGAGETVTIEGELSTKVHAHCALCLEEVTSDMTVQVSGIFSRQPQADDPDLYPIEGSKAEILDMIRDALLLELPMQFLCKEDCAGLCPVCGANRNRVACTCQEGGERQNPFTALKQLLTEDEEV